MTVAIDAKSNWSTSQNAVTSFTDASFTIGSGSNRALVVALVCEATTGNSPTAPTVNWDSTGTNQSMTLIATMSDNRQAHDIRIFLFSLVAPTSGNKTLSVAGLNANVDSLIAYISFTGVDQTGGTITFRNAITSAVGNGTTLTATVTSAIGDAVIAIFGSNSGSVSVNQTAWTNVQVGTTFGSDGYTGNYAIAVGTSTAMTLTQSAGNCNYAAMDILAASVGGIFMPPGQIWM